MKYLTFILFITQFATAQQPNKFVVRKDPSETNVVYNDVNEKAQFIGGPAEMNNFIVSHIKFPEKVKSDSSFYACKVYVKFEVDTNGKVLNPQIVRGCKGFDACDLEALRVIRMMPLWKPAESNGKKVKSVYNVPINFKLQ